MVKNLPAVQETRVRSLGQEDPLEKGIPTPVFLPREFHGQRSLAGYSLWDHKESDTTEQLTLSGTLVSSAVKQDNTCTKNMSQISLYILLLIWPLTLHGKIQYNLSISMLSGDGDQDSSVSSFLLSTGSGCRGCPCSQKMHLATCLSGSSSSAGSSSVLSLLREIPYCFNLL